jgi:hypothetical protein
MNNQKLLENIYYAALNHRDLHQRLMNDLHRDDLERERSRGLYDAYSYIVQMIIHNDTIGTVDYKKVYKMEETFPRYLKQ